MPATHRCESRTTSEYLTHTYTHTGYPFNQGLLSREVKLKEVEKTDDERFMEQLHPNLRWMPVEHTRYVFGVEITSKFVLACTSAMMTE